MIKQHEILVKSRRDPLFGFTAEGLEEAFRRKLEGRVLAAYFFGGFATGRLTPHSDIDLILIRETDRPFLSRAEEFADLFDMIPAIDLLIYTPAEFSRLTHNPTVGFWKSITASLRRFL